MPETSEQPRRLSLSQLRTSRHTSLPRRSYSLCLAAGLLAEMKSITEELLHLEPRQAPHPGDQPPARLGEGGPTARGDQLRARMAELRDLMEEHTGELVLEAWEPGKWQQFCDENPPREDVDLDTDVGLGWVNAHALFEHLDEFAVLWNGDPLGKGDWDFIESKAAMGDLREILRQVVSMHEGTVDLPKSLPGLLASPRNGNGSSSPNDSASLPGDSTAGSPESSTSASTPTGTASP